MNKKEKQEKLKKYWSDVFSMFSYTFIMALTGFGFVMIQILTGSNVITSLFLGMMLTSLATLMFIETLRELINKK